MGLGGSNIRKGGRSLHPFLLGASKQTIRTVERQEGRPKQLPLQPPSRTARGRDAGPGVSADRRGDCAREDAQLCAPSCLAAYAYRGARYLLCTM